MKAFLQTILVQGAALAVAVPLAAQATGTVFDDFDVNEGHFALQPTFSGSTVGILTSSTADRVTDTPVQGAGCERLVLNTNGAVSARVRFLSGGGTIGNNLAFTTSAATDGWIGFYARTTNAGWTVQLWIENASVNGGVPKSVVNDGQWHLYEWNLDDTAGDADGWGDISGIIAGSPTVADGSHTIDSIVLRNATVPDATSVVDIDYVARNDSGSVSNLLIDPCNNTSGVVVGGPLSTNSNQVMVNGVAGTATAITVYQDSGSGMVPIGTKTTGITAGNNSVTVAGLIKGATVAATQTVGGQESCVPTTGVLVGGGANPKLRLALSIKENPTATGPAGANGASGATSTILFVPCTSLVAGVCPGAGAIPISPSTSWQDVSVSLGRQTVGSSASASGATGDDTGAGAYIANDSVALRVYAFKTIGSTLVYSPTPAETSAVTSNAAFVINWTWAAVSDAEGYRLLRNFNGAGFTQFQDVGAVTSLTDPGFPWVDGDTVTPTAAQTTPSIEWNPTSGVVTNIAGDWGVLEAIALVADDPNDTGPYNIYIDDLANGSHGVFQDFEGFVAGAATGGVVFDQPSYSGTTAGAILGNPNDASIVNEAAYSGTKSQRAQWQFKSAGTNTWLRFTTFNTSAMPNPLVDLNQPISFKILVEPVGATPVPPPQPVLAVSLVNGQAVLSWTGAHNLQTSVNVSGTYTNVPGVITAPYTNAFPEAQRFFRLAN